MSSMREQGQIYLYFIVWPIYGWSFFEHGETSFPSSTLLTKFKLYTERPGGNVPDFGRMFLTLKYTDLTQNTYIQS